MVTISINGRLIENIELFVFDKDGTLIDLYTYWANMISLRAEKLCLNYKLDMDAHKTKLMYVMGVDTAKGRLRPEGPVGILPRKDVQKAAEDYLIGLGLSNTYETAFNVFKQVDELSLTLLDKFIKPIEGAIPLLKLLKDKGVKTAIATTDRSDRAELAMKHIEVPALIDLIVGADMVKHSKPAPDMLELICSRLGVSKANSVMVGDAETDIQMGNNAGFKASLAIYTGLTDKDTLSKYSDFLISGVSEIRIL